jgi:Trypsin-like peptidase domain
MSKILLIIGLGLGLTVTVAVVAISTSKSVPDDVPIVDPDTPPEKLADAISKSRKAPPGEEKTSVARPLDELVKECLPSVAIVKGKLGHGTGFMLPQNVLATNAHVVSLEFEENIRVHFPSAPKAQQGPYKAKFIWADLRRDLAFLEVNCDVEPLELAEDYTLKPGQEVIAIGSPGLGGKDFLPNSPTKGLMSNMYKINRQQFYALSMSVNPGNSGGPVIDMSGKVLGMVTLKAKDKDGIAFAIPLEDLNNGYHQEVLAQGREAGVELTSWLRASTVFERIIYLGEEYLLGLDTYSRAMDLAHSRGASPNDGLKSVTKEMAERIKQVNAVFSDALEQNLRLVVDDKNIDPEIRQRIGKMWECCREMKSYFDQPRGTIDSYRAKKTQLRRQFHELVDGKSKPAKPSKKTIPKDPDDDP